MNKEYDRYDLYCLATNEVAEFLDLGEVDTDILDFTFDDIMSGLDYVWMDIKNDENKLIGYLSILLKPEIYPGIDFDIESMYILPEYRRQGYMSKTVKRFLDENFGGYSYCVIKEDEVTANFWQKVISDNNCKPIDVDDVYNYVNLEIRGFRRER